MTAGMLTRQAAGIQIILLGGFRMVIDNRAVDPANWHRRHAAALVKILALTPGRSLHREQLVELLWPGTTIGDAAPRLHKAAHYARRSLSDGRAVVLAHESVALLPDADVDVDVWIFQALAESALRTDDVAAAGAAADSYQGDLLPLDLYENWAWDSRERLRLLYLRVLRLAGRWDQLTAVEPTDESAQLELMGSLFRRGDHHGALRQFARLERALRQELGVAPSRAAYQLRHQVSLEARR